MANTNENKTAVFLRDTAPIILEIIKKNNLRETPEEAIEAIKNGKIFRAGIILNIVKKIIENKELKKDLVSMLQKELNISGDIADNVAKDVESELLPIGRLASLGEIADASKKFAETKIITEEIKKPITSIPIKPAAEASVQKVKPKGKSTLPSEKIEKTKKPVPQTRQPSGPDSYRESIE